MRSNSNYLLKSASLFFVGFIFASCYKGPLKLNQPPTLPVENAWIKNAPQEIWDDRMFSPPGSLIPLAENELLVLTYRGEIYRYNLTSGRRTGRVWQPLRRSISSYLIANQNKILYFASARDEEVRAYNLMDARKLWKLEYPGIVGNMAAVGTRLFAATENGAMIAINRAEGELDWEQRFPGRFMNGVFGFDNRILAINDRGQLYGFDVIYDDSITLAWQQTIALQPIYQAVSTPQQLLLFDSAGLIQAIDPASGKVSFSKLMPDPIYSKPLIAGQTMIVATASGRIYGLNLKGGDILWEYEGPGLVKLPIVAATGTTPTVAVIPYSRGRLVALEIASGRVLWEYQFEHTLRLATITDSGIAVVDTRNRLHFLGPVASGTTVED